MNIIFDLGGVVFNWNPNKLIEHYFTNENDKEKIKEVLFNHQDWIDLDRGTLTRDEAVERASNRSNFNKDIISLVLDSVPSSLTPINETISLFSELRKNNHKLYVLSNMHIDSVKYLKANYDFWDLFEGVVFSSDIKMVKPNRDIFDFITKEYNLDIKNSLFIDDTYINIETAKNIGFKTIHFKTSFSCMSELKNLNLI